MPEGRKLVGPKVHPLKVIGPKIEALIAEDPHASCGVRCDCLEPLSPGEVTQAQDIYEAWLYEYTSWNPIKRNREQITRSLFGVLGMPDASHSGSLQGLALKVFLWHLDQICDTLKLPRLRP